MNGWNKWTRRSHSKRSLSYGNNRIRDKRPCSTSTAWTEGWPFHRSFLVILEGKVFLKHLTIAPGHNLPYSRSNSAHVNRFSGILKENIRWARLQNSPLCNFSLQVHSSFSTYSVRSWRGKLCDQIPHSFWWKIENYFTRRIEFIWRKCYPWYWSLEYWTPTSE